MPINDLKEHSENSICECKPKIIYENGEMIIVHNSYDGREGLELYNKLINENCSNNKNV